ncbi:uncharacterized protein LOC109828037 isoform X2 [Asparagus officinalis]|uniref:uncharacterized protein LOC109828037 isoform X2 n=1 Tax=Asparagus officinalis TaxID=4686 RepID=UPI00098E821B|nr:uncharacterized protein LOC109828037 isoform X2 [Asparagus officinalis]
MNTNSSENCIGAIDGSHFRVKVTKEDTRRYRGRKEFPTQNVLAACTFDLKFTYVLAGWEGSASDSRVLNNALIRQDKLFVPQGDEGCEIDVLMGSLKSKTKEFGIFFSLFG